MITITHNATGDITAIQLYETTYSPAALVALAQEVERLRAIVNAAMTLRDLDRVPLELFELGAWSAAERDLYAAVDALTVRKGNTL